MVVPLGRDAVIVQVGSYRFCSFASQHLRKDALYHFRLHRVYHKIFTIPAVAIRCRAEFIRTILKTILNRPLAVFGNGHRFAFCKAAQRGQQELPFHFAGVQVFFFKIDGDVQFHQPAHQFQTICSVPRKPTD